MKINIYYGGRGLVSDPTICVMNRIQSVLEDLNVKVTRYNLFEEKRNITALPSTINDADGIVLACTVEWHGIGGYMHEFLDACWLYGNKEHIADVYMCPVVMSTTYGEKEGTLDLIQAWELLGGKQINGICGYVKDTASFELDKTYMSLIEKKTENIYRSISQKMVSLPASSQMVNQMISSAPSISLTPQETEQLSKYASDENYIQTQKEDIRELTSHFKTLLGNNGISEEECLVRDFRDHFNPKDQGSATFKFVIKEIKNPLIISVDGGKLDIRYGNIENPSIKCTISLEKLNSVMSGHMTFHRAFMVGDMQVMGDFTVLNMLDSCFEF